MLKTKKILVFGLLALLVAAPVGARKYVERFDSLQRWLIKDGFDSSRIQALYSQPGVVFDTRGVSLYFVHKESSLNYDQFTKSWEIKQAKKYMRTHAKALNRAEQTYGVDKEVITAIALVETRLGTYVGDRSVFNTLSTMAALWDPKIKEMLWRQLDTKRRLSRAEFDRKSREKALWAYEELKAFLKYTRRENIHPLTVTGSYAGAMGICQFMPSNVLSLAKDGDGDGRINLFDHDDAIMSIASYLSHYGWRPRMKGEAAYQVVYTYNHSSYYVNAVLKIAQLLKG